MRLSTQKPKFLDKNLRFSFAFTSMAVHKVSLFIKQTRDLVCIIDKTINYDRILSSRFKQSKETLKF